MNNIIGHDKQIDYFNNLIENKTYLHAYLFEGADGIGKKTLALAIAEKILCNNEADARLFHAGNFNDFMLVSPEDNEIKTEQVKNIHEYLMLAPSRGEKKIVLIDNCDKMNLHAQNKILKIIEEPPAYAMFILITSNKEAMIDTLCSRLIRISFHALSMENLRLFTENKGLVYDEQLAISSGGSVAKYQDLLSSDNNEVHDFALKLIDALQSKNKIDLFHCVKEAEGYKDNLYDVFDNLEILSYRACGINTESEVYEMKEKNDKAIAFSKYMEIIAETRWRYLRNVQKDLLISNLIYRMQGVFK